MVYNPYYSWNVGQASMVQQPYIQQSNTFAWVQGEAAAKAYAVAPGATVVLMDTESPVLYMKSTDQNGRPAEIQKRFLITEEEYRSLKGSNESNEYVTKEDFDKYISDAEKKFAIKEEEDE